MSQVTAKPDIAQPPSLKPEPEPFPYPRVQLIESDGVPLESDWHRLAITLLIDLVFQHMAGREDYFVGGNMFIYFNEEQARNLDYRGPDVFFVRGVPLNPPRRYWAIWLEGGRYPDVIFELASPSTIQTDRTVKKDLYEKVFHTHEYFLFDPDGKTLQGWRLVDHSFQPIEPNEQGWLWSEELGLWVGAWTGKFQGKDGVYPRLYTRQGTLVPTDAEAKNEQTGVERRRADSEAQRAETEKERAEAAEAEVARLRALLGQTGERTRE